MPITEDYVKYLMEQNASMTEQISQLTSTVKELNQTIKELQEQLKMNPKNSSKPPSSDGLKNHQLTRIKVYARLLVKAGRSSWT